MSPQKLKALLDKLNPYCIEILENAAGFAGTRGHYEVTIEHLLIKLLEQGEGDMEILLRHFSVNLDSFWQALLDQLERMRSDNQSKPAFSLQLAGWFEKAWTITSLRSEETAIRSGILFEALLEMAPLLPGTAWTMISHITQEQVTTCYPELNKISCEGPQPVPQSQEPNSSVQATNNTAPTSSTPNLDAYTDDFTARARQGNIDPVLGRNDEIRQMIDILTRRRKNNPILVGEPGVGKSAVVEGLALRIAERNVPKSLKDVRLVCLDLGLLQAGAGVKGEFEKRLKAVIDEIRNSPTPIILFIDEAHTLIGAGGDVGQGDAANLLKPALARGELRTLAATTWSEYKKYFERDAALERRFQMVKIDEPAIETAIVMLNGLKQRYQEHHQVLITDEAVAAAVNLSSRYINGRYLPDKAIDLLDTASARVAMGQAATPAALDSVREQLTFIERRQKYLFEEREQGLPVDQDQLDQLEEQRVATLEEIIELELRWQTEVAMVKQLQQQRADKGKSGDLAKLQNDLKEVQEQAPLVQAEVNADTVAQIVADWTGVPLGRMVKNELSSLIEFEERISQRIIGQYPALNAIGQTIRSSKSGLQTSDGPVGVFLLTGPSGIGKTETARAIADTLFGGERFMVTINMSEYQEAHTVSQLKGSPPGYVGYGEGGVLTEAVRQRPYSVILLDEVEKAHPEVLNLFYQVFDRGFMRDGEGREIDFKNTVILMTSNLGSEALLNLFADDTNEIGTDTSPSKAEANSTSLKQETTASEENSLEPTFTTMVNAVRPELQQHFAAALLARIQVVPLAPLNQEVMRQIILTKLDKVAQRLAAVHDISLRCKEDVIEHLLQRCQRPESGARTINSLIEQQLLPGISRSLLQFMAAEDMPQLISLEIDDQQELSCIFSDLETTNGTPETVTSED